VKKQLQITLNWNKFITKLDGLWNLFYLNQRV